MLYAGWVLSLVILLVVIHELLHALVAILLGFEVVFQFHANTRIDWKVSVVAFGENQTRLETAVIALVPLAVITPAGAAVLLLGSQGAVIAASLVLVVNSTGAILDIRTALLMLLLPSDALVRHDSRGREQYYVPKN